MDKDHISFKEAVLILQTYVRYLLSKWYVYLIVALLFGGISFWKTSQKEPLYTARASFMTTKDGGSGLSGMLQLAGRFGLGGSKSELSGEKIVELLGTKKMIYATLFKTVSIDGKEDLLLNHYIDLLGLRAVWQNNPSLRDMRFDSSDLDALTLQQSEILQRIYQRIINFFLRPSSSDTGIIQVATNSPNEAFSYIFTKELVATITDFYISRSVEQQQETYKIVEARVDSIEKALYSAEYALGNWLQTNRKALRVGALDAQKLVAKERLERKAEILAVMFEEASKNREVALYTLQSNTPVMQIIDLPQLPLEKEQVSKTFSLILAIIGAGLLTTIVLAFYKLVSDLLKAED